MYLISPVGSSSLAWNVSGAGPYDPGNRVITYPWQGGAINEQWRPLFVPQIVTSVREMRSFTRRRERR